MCLSYPRGEDGTAVFRLVKNYHPLDINAVAETFFSTALFYNTSASIQLNGFVNRDLVGFISGHELVGDRARCLFGKWLLLSLQEG
jgi:hypothetical protein